MAKLEDKEYVRAPYSSRAEYVGIASDILHSPQFAHQMPRRHKDASVDTMLRATIRPENIDYLLNGARFLDWESEIGT